MTLDDYLAIKEQLRKYADEVEERKRPSYTHDNTCVLENFKRDGKLQGIPSMQNWLAHFLKQVAAVTSYIKNPDILPSEPLISRMADIRNYTTLGLALAAEEKRGSTGLEEIKTKDKPTIKISKDSDYGN